MCLLPTWTWFPDSGCLPWLCLRLILGIPRWSQATLALTPGFSLPLTKMVTSHTLSWGHLNWNHSVITATCSIYCCIPHVCFSMEVSGVTHGHPASVGSSHLISCGKVEFREKAQFATSFFYIEVLCFALPMGSTSCFRFLQGPRASSLSSLPCIAIFQCLGSQCQKS